MEKQIINLRNKREKGITLVALVITIIVLIILAGVSINAVMNDGLIGNAKNARNDYEAAKRKEEIALIDLEVQTDFLNASTPYNFNNGYLTGVLMENRTSSIGRTESVFELWRKLPSNYKILNVDGSEIEDTSIPVGTGMIIAKGDNELGKILIYGDVDLIDGIDSGDSAYIDFFVYYKLIFIGEEEVTYEEGVEIPQYLLLAMDVDHNNIINLEDADLIDRIVFDNSDEVIEQNVTAPSYDDIVIEFAEE